jgi:DNA-binding NarL/FixJ family response regulator
MHTECAIKILIADDHEIVRCGVKALVAGTEIYVVAEAATGQAATELALQTNVDLVLLDVRMPDVDGLTVLGRIKLNRPKLPVLIFSAFDNPASIAKAIALGASGFLLKGCPQEKLLSAIRAVASGETNWNRHSLLSASRSLRTPRGGSLEVSVSERQLVVLRQMARGLTNKQIAETMEISVDKVLDDVRQLFQKLGVVDRTQAALWALRNNLL